MKELNELTRTNIRSLKAYSSARDEYKGVEASVFLDANESPFNLPLNRYPDPLQYKVKKVLATMHGVNTENIFLGNGSDEAIDLVYRVFCEPGVDNVVAIDPTYGMYQVCAEINNVAYRKVLLDAGYQFSAKSLLAATDEQTKLIFLCSPNNPTGNDLCAEEMNKVLDHFEGLVIIDEAYITFSEASTFVRLLGKYPNLIVLQTFSKAMGLAGIRLGMAFASAEVIALFNKVKYPYNVNSLTQEAALKQLTDSESLKKQVRLLIDMRIRMADLLPTFPFVEKVYPSDANFLLVKVKNAQDLYAFLVKKGIIVRNRSSISLCRDCLRITMGNEEENNALISAFENYKLEYQR